MKSIEELCKSHNTRTYFEHTTGGDQMIGVFNHRNVVLWYRPTEAGYSLVAETPDAGTAWKRTITEHYIGIGFCQPKFYKPSVWRKAKKIMEWLCDNTPHVYRFDFGRGMGKYRMQGEWDKRDFWKQAIPDLGKLYDAKN